MSNLNRWKSGTALLIALGLSAGTVTPIVAPLIAPAPVLAQSTTFSDVSSNYWARDFIAALAARGVIAGFPDGTFRPESPVTRAQFAAMLTKAFNNAKVRDAVAFSDVPSDYWARAAIREAYEEGFLAGYPGNVFRPNQNIPREQVLVSLANGLNYSPTGSTENVLGYYSDASGISGYAESSIAAATEKGLVVNYPNVRSLNPTRNATRAEVAAFIYQALVNQGQAAAINSPYVVSLTPTTPPVSSFRIPSGTTIPVRYDKERILVTQDERAPVTVTVGANITTSNGTVLIPAGSEIAGEVRPAQGGSQFVAQTLTLPNNRQLAIDASSQVITRTETIRRGASAGELIRGAVLGSAAAAAVAGVTGDRTIRAEEVLGGTAFGTLISLFLGRDRVDLVVIDPETDLNLRLNQDLVIGTGS
ncbi:MAG: S-layer homology domain-containing protein [Aphanothece sp. CMT-3BRIN-NPC111]|jgi:hypothetical protein|nr:S-layer homology domain-containing protein [Aphanothece sp. CMT-3BRIN-NPC111]